MTRNDHYLTFWGHKSWELGLGTGLGDIRLIAADLDGTLLGVDHRVSDRTMDVLARAQAAGITTIAATGRGPIAVPEFEPAGVIELAVCSNGAAVIDLATRQVIERTDLAGAAAETALAEIRAAIHGACFAWESERGFGVESEFVPHGEVLISSYPQDTEPFDPATPLTKLFVAAPNLGYQELARQVKAALTIEAEVSSAGLPFVVITAPGVTKATTLDRLCRQRAIDAAQVIAFGDSWNDLEMLDWAGIGVAMGNANEDVRQAADAVADSHDQDGVAKFLTDLLKL